MLKSIVLLFIFIILAFYQIVLLVKEKLIRETVIFSVLVISILTIAIAQANDVTIPNPLEFVGYVLKPINKLLP
ncbi:hypothetical protein ACOSZE_06695 [Lysinibacillus fusiformis]|uniref:hypothetical protein n=1 Tax=Lysinibacillus fusiformis TaxID=28031 RepID=UPI003BA02508